MSGEIPSAHNIDHVGVSIPNLDQAISFFQNVLGAEFLFRFEESPGTVLEGPFQSGKGPKAGQQTRYFNRDVACSERPVGMSKGFAYYRAAALSASQNLEFSKQQLRMPVLAWGGSAGMGDNLRKLVEPLAAHVQGGAIDDCGHYVMEEQPEVLAGKLLDFFKHAEDRAR